MMNFKIVYLDETDSTNRWMKENGEGEMVVVADYQTAGKGCGQNSWESERGKNLLMSMLVHPKKVSARTQFIITQMVSVALCNVLERYLLHPKPLLPGGGDNKLPSPSYPFLTLSTAHRPQKVRRPLSMSSS